MKTNNPRNNGIFLGLCPAAMSTVVSAAMIRPVIVRLMIFLPIFMVSATGCDQSQTARRSSAGSSSGSVPSIDERLGAPPSDIRFEAPVRIFAGETPVSVEAPGYACPTMVDVDGDGADDLVVGQFARGQMKFYRNENKPGQTPMFGKGVWIRTGGDVARVPGVS